MKETIKVEVLKGPREGGGSFGPPTREQAGRVWGEGREGGLLLC